KAKVNWWSAFTWCQHQGRHLVSLQEVCEGWHGGATGNALCGNLIKSDVTTKNCWTANPYDSTRAYAVGAGTGTIHNAYSGIDRANSMYSAFCY
ncbi:MAG: hypothetical protein ACI4RJ_03910, partial [Alphaproteobacteria bacterium]